MAGRGHYHPASCRRCGVHKYDCENVSQTGLCPDCAKVAVVSNVEQMAARRGPNFARWRERMAASVGAVLLDASSATAQTDEP